jgi:hypothetical protein
VAAEMALQMKKFNLTSNKSQSSDVCEHQLKLAEEILNFNVALSASLLANLEQVLPCFFLEVFNKKLSSRKLFFVNRCTGTELENIPEKNLKSSRRVTR